MWRKEKNGVGMLGIKREKEREREKKRDRKGQGQGKGKKYSGMACVIW